MENFVLPEGTDTLKDSRELLNNALLTVRSLSSGTAFPTDNLSAGMLCYRTDLKRLYQYKEDGSWAADISMSISGNANTANSAGTAASADHADTADTCTGNAATATTAASADKCTGNSATATALKTARSINGVSFDGSKNIDIPVGVKTVNGIEPDANGDVLVAGMPIGHEWWTANPNIPAGCLPLFGGTFSRSAYADLWAWVQTQTGYLIGDDEWQMLSSQNGGNVPFYSDGDGSTTFRVPSLKCWVKGASGIEEVGSYLEAGLPNITGTFDAMEITNGTNNVCEGALYGETSSIKYIATGNSGTSLCIKLDASRSNPIYGASDTVQPPSVVGMWLVKAFGTVSNVGNQDIADISSGLRIVESRIGRLENNSPSEYVIEYWRQGTEWYRIWSDGLVEQGGQTEATKGSTERVISLYNIYSDTNYNLLLGSGSGGSNSLQYNSFQWTAKTASTFTAKAGCSENIVMDWYACGKGPSGPAPDAYVLMVDATSGKYASAYTITTTVDGNDYTGSIVKNVPRGASVTITATGSTSGDWRYDGSTVVVDGVNSEKTSHTFSMNSDHTVTFTDGSQTYIGSGT